MKQTLDLLAHVSAVLGTETSPTRGLNESLALRVDQAIDDLTKGLTVHVQPRFEFGQWRMYPACPTALKFAALIGQKTLTAYQVSLLQDLGYKIVPKIDATEFNALIAKESTGG